MVSLADMRRDARAAFDAAVAAVQPQNLVPRQIEREGNRVLIAGKPLPGSPGRRVVMAIGKAAPGLAAAWIACLPGWSNELFVLTPHGVAVPHECGEAATILRGAHPIPDADGVASTRRLLGVARSLGRDDALVVLLSGGGSALLAAPEDGLEITDISETTDLLLRSGAPIGEINAVRRQLMSAAGGGLGRAAFPASVGTVILSDVIGNSIQDIASGPTVPSESTPADALAVLTRHAVSESVPRAVVGFLENARDRRAEDGAWATGNWVRIIADNRSAVDGAAGWLADHGYAVRVAGESVVGEASECGREIAARALARASEVASAVVFGGETTVTVRGSGRGGRNQELALAAALEIENSETNVILAAGTDGVDGNSENAGAVVDQTTAARLKQRGLNAREALAENDSSTALEAVGDAFRTGPTGTNVCDLTLVLSGPTSGN